MATLLGGFDGNTLHTNDMDVAVAFAFQNTAP